MWITRRNKKRVLNIKVIHGLKNTCIGGAADAAALYLRTELRYRGKKDGIRKFVKIIKKLFQIFFAQVKIEVTKGQKVNFEKNVVFDDNVIDLKDRTILAASCLSRQGASKHIKYYLERSSSNCDPSKGHGGHSRSPTVFANNLRSKWDRDVGLVSLRLSPQSASNDA